MNGSSSLFLSELYAHSEFQNTFEPQAVPGRLRHRVPWLCQHKACPVYRRSYIVNPNIKTLKLLLKRRLYKHVDVSVREFCMWYGPASRRGRICFETTIAALLSMHPICDGHIYVLQLTVQRECGCNLCPSASVEERAKELW